MASFRVLFCALTAGLLTPLVAIAEYQPSQSATPLISGSRTMASSVRIEMEDQAPNGQLREKLNFESDSMTADRRAIETIQRKLQQTHISKVDFRDATLREVLKFLYRETGVPIVDLSGNLPNEKSLPENIIEPGDARVTFSLENVSAAEVLRYATSLVGLNYWRIIPGAVVIKPFMCAIRSLEAEDFHVLAVINGMPIKEFLESKGVQFPPGSTFNYNASKGCLSVRNLGENLRRIELILEELSSQPKNIGTEEELTQELELRETLEWKRSLEKTVILNAEIHDASLEEIIRELRLKVSPWVGAQIDSKIRISLSMKKVPVTDLLRQIAELTKTQVVIGLGAIVFVPAANP